MRTRRVVGGIAMGILLASGLPAHDTWILPLRAGSEPGRKVAFDLTSGMAFPANESGVEADRLARASVRLGEEELDLRPTASGESALRLETTLPAAGIATVCVETKPRSVDLTPAQVREYLEEIGAWESIGREWESRNGGRWRESYTKHAKTYVGVGSTTSSSESSWNRPAGMALELVPESDPTRLNVAGELPVRLLKDGRPLAGIPVGLVAAGAKSGSLATTDAEGRVRLRLNRPGWWLVRATVLEASSKPDLEWESKFTTLTVFAGRRRMH